MTQQSTQFVDGVGHFINDFRDQLDQSRKGAPEMFRAFRRDYPEWLWVSIPMVILAIYAYAMTWMSWFGFERLLIFQPFVPFAVGYAIWRDREATRIDYDETMEPFLPDSPKRRGSLVPLFLGCLIMLGGTMTTLTWLCIVGLVVTLISAVYAFFGGYALRLLLQPLFYLLFLIPPPLVLITMLTQWLQIGSTVVAGQILQTFMHDVHVQGTFINLPNYSLEVSAPCSGVSILFPVVALTAFLALFKRLHLSWTGIMLVIAIMVAMAMNVVRIVVMGLIGGVNPAAAHFLHDSNSMLFAGFSFYLTFLIGARIQRGPRRRLSAFERDLAASYYSGTGDGEEQAR